MKIYEEPHRFHGLTWRIVFTVEGAAILRGLITEPRPRIHLYDNGDPAPEWRGQFFPDLSREEVLAFAKELGPVLMREPNFGKRSMSILHAAMGSAKEWSLEKKIQHLNNDNRRRVRRLVDRLLEEQK